MTRPADYLNRLFVHPAWMATAPCRGATPYFYPERPENTGDKSGASARHAKAICATCPHKLPCLEYAIDNNEDHGVWGGHTVRERREIARNRRAMGWTTGRYRQIKRTA